jgi:putative endonuclease
MNSKDAYVYILTNKHNTVLYTGMSTDLVNRMIKHRNKLYEGFTKKYNIDKLVYFEGPHDVDYAIKREKQIKSGSRKKKIELINSINPEWRDLFNDLLPNNYKKIE